MCCKKICKYLSALGWKSPFTWNEYPVFFSHLLYTSRTQRLSHFVLLPYIPSDPLSQYILSCILKKSSSNHCMFRFVSFRSRPGIAIELAAAFVSASELRCTVPAQVAGSFRVAASLDGKNFAGILMSMIITSLYSEFVKSKIAKLFQGSFCILITRIYHSFLYLLGFCRVCFCLIAKPSLAHSFTRRHAMDDRRRHRSLL